MKRVCANAFYAGIGNLDVTLTTIGDPPYTTIFKLRHSGKEIGRIIGKDIWLGQQNEYELTDDVHALLFPKHVTEE